MTLRPTVVLADDHPLVCSGLKTMLEPQYAVVAMVHDGKDVLGSVARYQPDLVLMDLSLPGRTAWSSLGRSRNCRADRRW